MKQELLIHLLTFLTLFSGYFLVLRKTGRFQLNRIILLLIPVIASVIPFISFSTSTEVAAAVMLPEIQAGLNSIGPVQTSQPDLLLLIWMIGALVFTGILIPRLVMSFTISDSQSGYSFLRNFYVNQDLDIPLSKAIESHEKVHVSKKHSYDILFLELCRIVLWFNPMIHLLIREVRLNHEYEADSIASSQHEEYAKMLVSQHFKVDHRLLGHSFGKSNLKKRLIMIQKQKTKSTGRYLLFAGLTLLSLTLVSWNIQISNPIDFVKSTKEHNGDLDKNPQYVGGKDALMQYMQESLEYPDEAKKKNIEGRVIISFVVTEKGKVTKVKVENSDNPIFNESALEVVRAMPDWQPGEKDGKKVAAEMKIPILYKL